jgi:hypothetical protein
VPYQCRKHISGGPDSAAAAVFILRNLRIKIL